MKILHPFKRSRWETFEVSQTYPIISGVPHRCHLILWDETTDANVFRIKILRSKNRQKIVASNYTHENCEQYSLKSFYCLSRNWIEASANEINRESLKRLMMKLSVRTPVVRVCFASFRLQFGANKRPLIMVLAFSRRGSLVFPRVGWGWRNERRGRCPATARTAACIPLRHLGCTVRRTSLIGGAE